ncbi:MAG: endonuclease/exonuclease/phosphatase family protein [Bacteroidales bacterium]|nr:endonuclease/exonuclease/phosphatase family protein [Bacteroidales bacterium]
MKLFSCRSMALFIMLGILATSCQNNIQRLRKPANGLTFAFYNIENLFDTLDDPKIIDEEFLPTAKGQWNTQRFNHKLENIARVIAAMDTTDYPDMIGFAEIENLEVLQMLADQDYIRKANYKLIHYPDHDDRGIEVAFMYRPEYFKPLYSKPIDYIIDSLPKSNPRHILYLKGIVATKDTLHLFINHWTSRYGGQKETVEARNAAGSFLRNVTDTLMRLHDNPNIIIAGDLNDNPTDESLITHLKALPLSTDIEPNKLYNLALNPFLSGTGTLYYKSWDFFDQVIISSNLARPVEGKLKSGEIEIIKKDWMLYKTKDGIGKPNRTYSGGKYFGGYSDHLPVMIRLAIID